VEQHSYAEKYNASDRDANCIEQVTTCMKSESATKVEVLALELAANRDKGLTAPVFVKPINS
jgi:hypothetical protein